MKVVRDLAELRQLRESWRGGNERVAFVPTMGNLHAGHLALVEHARGLAERVVASIFVNPTQFGPGEDFEAYPRTPEEDRGALEAAGCDALFLPELATMYPEGAEAVTTVSVPGLSDGLCGASRPGHFDGVATVVTRLFNMVQPDVAAFGEKDYQQLLVIRRLVRDLSMPLAVVGVPTVREADGLAMSSRNRYLDPAQRKQAPALYRSLERLRQRIGEGTDPREAIDDALRQLSAAGLEPEYLELRSAEDLGPPRAGVPTIALAAARLGPARLIDNLRLDP